MSRSILLTIVAHARSGALDQAWRLFREAGLEAVDDDPSVLSVLGRLLKDQGLAAAGEARRTLYRQAAEAYGRAGAISGATYPLINAATLALLGGDRAGARSRAADVLARLQAGPAEPDTPYYLAATRAEALLLLGDVAEARDALVEAVALAPQAWEDHASTLRQFARILEAVGEDGAWLEPLRPPRSLHFAGHMSLAPDDAGDDAAGDDVASRVRETLAALKVGFGYGALAAGADIVIAEALLELGAQLHIVLPVPPDVFRRTSVDGRDGWSARFDAVLERADTLHWLGDADDDLHPAATRLAAETAMGLAVMNARTLASAAAQLLILDESPEGESGRMGAVWRAAGLDQHIIPAPRLAPTAAAMAADPPRVTTAALLLIELLGDGAGLAGAIQLAAAASRLAEAVAALTPALLAQPSWRGGCVQLAFASPLDAAAAALDLAGRIQGRIAGAYDLAVRVSTEGAFLVGPATVSAGRILASTPTGAVHVSETFAAALELAPAQRRPRTEHVGDLPGAEDRQLGRLFSLKPPPT